MHILVSERVFYGNYFEEQSTFIEQGLVVGCLLFDQWPSSMERYQVDGSLPFWRTRNLAKLRRRQVLKYRRLEAGFAK